MSIIQDDPMAAYRDLLGSIDAWTARSAAANPGVIPCAKGCSSCCHGPFDISMADAALLANAVGRLDESVRSVVRGKALMLLERMHVIAPDWTAPHIINDIGDDAFDALCNALAHVPCPLLDETGACRVYEDRPLVCRLIGVPMSAGDDRIIPNACPIQEDFPAYEALAPQPFDLDAFDEAEEQQLVEGANAYLGDGAKAEMETTIAAVIINALSAPCPGRYSPSHPASPLSSPGPSTSS